jgi:hypothetical protein
MFGKVNQKELDQIVKQGWEVMRCPSNEEVDKFCDPKWKKTESEPETAETADDIFVLVYVDNDISHALTTWFNEDVASKECQAREELESKRRIVADDALGCYSFELDEGDKVSDTDIWDTDGLDRLICSVYITGRYSENNRKISFIVDFKPNTAECLECHANHG